MYQTAEHTESALKAAESIRNLAGNSTINEALSLARQLQQEPSNTAICVKVGLLAVEVEKLSKRPGCIGYCAQATKAALFAAMYLAKLTWTRPEFRAEHDPFYATRALEQSATAARLAAQAAAMCA